MDLISKKKSLFFLPTSAKRKRGGFTLIELLVVIAVVGLLSTIVLITIHNVHAQARDNRRMAELATLAKILDFYNGDHDQYPEAVDWIKIEEDAGFASAISPYITEIPQDPLYDPDEPGGVYSYQYTTSDTGASEYKACAVMETQAEAYCVYSSGGGIIPPISGSGGGNNNPDQPGGLWVDGQGGTPSDISTTPFFSAVYNDPDSGDIATDYRIQVALIGNDYSSSVWDSLQTALSAGCVAGDRCEDITYGAAPLTESETYKWHIMYWDDNGAASDWSTDQQFATEAAPPPAAGHWDKLDEQEALSECFNPVNGICYDLDTYVYTFSDTEQKDAYSIEDIAGSGDIDNVYVYIRQIGCTKTYIILNGVEDNRHAADESCTGPSYVSGKLSYPWNMLNFGTRPDGGDWTWADINDPTFQVVVGLSSENSDSAQISQVQVVVQYDGGSFTAPLMPTNDGDYTNIDYQYPDGAAGNRQPRAPETPHCEGQPTPVGNVSDSTPEFTAIFDDPNLSDKAYYYEIEVNTEPDFSGTVMWDTGQVAFGTPVNEHSRCPDIVYNGSALAESTTYHWRIRFWDEFGVTSLDWSATQQFTMAGPVTELRSPSSTGDDYNEWVLPTYAFTSNNLRAIADYDPIGQNNQDYYNFGFNVPGGATINGVEVILEGYGRDLLGMGIVGPSMTVRLSWNGGANYTSWKTAPFISSSDVIRQVGGSSDTWGRTWSASDFSDANFRLHLKHANDDVGDIYLDHAQVQIYYVP